MVSKLWELVPSLDMKSWNNDQGKGSLVTFFVAAFLLGVAVLIGLILVLKVFMKPPTVKFLTEIGFGFLTPSEEVLNIGEVITLGVVFLIGMVVALVSIYIFKNQALQKVVHIYTLLCAYFGLFVYMKIALNFYNRSFNFGDRFPKYLLALVVVNAAVFVLPLLYDRYVVRPFAIPIFIGNFFHLMLILGHNVFVGVGELISPFSFRVYYMFHYFEKVWEKVRLLPAQDLKKLDVASVAPFTRSVGPDLYFFVGDLFLFVFMVIIAISFVRNAPFFASVKRQLGFLFPSDET